MFVEHQIINAYQNGNPPSIFQENWASIPYKPQANLQSYREQDSGH